MAGSFISNFNKANTATSTLASQIQKALDPVFNRIILQLKNVVRAIEGLPPIRIHADTSQASAALGGLLSQMQRLGISTVSGNKGVPPVVTASGGAMGGLVTDSGIHRFAAGGYAGQDTIPAMLAAGEFVLRSDAVARLGLPLVRALNEGMVLAGTRAPAPARSEGSMRGPVSIEGTLTLSPDGTAYIRGIAKDEIDRESRWRNN